MARRQQSSSRPKALGQVRIISGKWRGSKLPVADYDTLRPSPDRVRETLFNWLGPYLPGARCLDLFCGTGVLGIEAVSRGAEKATLIDNHPPTIDLLRRQIERLEAENVQILNVDALSWLRTTTPSAFNVVFLDPPFGHGLIESSLDELRRGWLVDNAWVYLETEKIPILHLESNGWTVRRQGKTRQIEFALLSAIAPGDPTLAS
jgi:16S rRNA (guanine966-N2)-methyltransferase